MAVSIRVSRSPEDIERCVVVRRIVFVEGQGVTEREEVDGLDPECAHLLAEDEGRLVGTARLRDGGQGKAKAERVAVLEEQRGRGTGRALMRALEEAAREAGFREVVLAAQVSAIPFYERLGYEAYGEPFFEARIEHRYMRLPLEPAS